MAAICWPYASTRIQGSGREEPRDERPGSRSRPRPPACPCQRARARRHGQGGSSQRYSLQTVRVHPRDPDSLERVAPGRPPPPDMAREGLPTATPSKLSGTLGWTRAALIEQLGIAPRTAARRLTRREPLSTAESERVLRLARVLTRAIDVFESQDAAKQWLQEPSTALGERKPIDLLATDIGTEVVLNELGKIDYGFFA